MVSKKQGESGIIPIGNNVLLKGIIECSIIQLNGTMPKEVIWELLLDDCGEDVPQQIKEAIKTGKRFSVRLEYGDKTMLIKTNDNPLSFNRQKELIQLKGIKGKGEKLQIVEYIITPAYNIVAILENKKEESLFTAYDIKDTDLIIN